MTTWIFQGNPKQFDLDGYFAAVRDGTVPKQTEPAHAMNPHWASVRKTGGAMRDRAQPNHSISLAVAVGLIVTFLVVPCGCTEPTAEPPLVVVPPPEPTPQERAEAATEAAGGGTAEEEAERAWAAVQAMTEEERQALRDRAADRAAELARGEALAEEKRRGALLEEQEEGQQ